MRPLGHSEAEVWTYTPRKMHALLFIAAKRRQAEHKELLALHTMAARGEPKEVRRHLRDDAGE